LREFAQLDIGRQVVKKLNPVLATLLVTPRTGITIITMRTAAKTLNKVIPASPEGTSDADGLWGFTFTTGSQ